jgi:hypothetical protein
VNSTSNKTPVERLFVTRPLTLAYLLSLFIALLMTAVSLGSVVLPSTIYPTKELLETYLANDVVNLVIGLPLLLGTMWLTKRGGQPQILYGTSVALAYRLVPWLESLPGTPG